MAKDTCNLALSFVDEAKATRSLRVPNPKPELGKEQVLPVMNQIVAGKAVLSKNKKPVIALKSARISTIKDLGILDEA